MTATPEGRIALSRVFRNALLIRLALAVLLHVFTGDYTFAPDQETYHIWSAMLSRYWWGDSLMYPHRIAVAGEPRAYYYIVASLYAVFGEWAIVPKLVNAVVGAISVRLVFDLALKISLNEAIALRSATYTAYFPSLVLWSVLNIRDTWVVLLILLICRQALRLQETFRFGYLILLAGSVYVVSQFRAYLLFAVTLPMLLSFLIRHKTHIIRNVTLGMLVAGAVIYTDQASGSRRMRTLDFDDLNASRRWSATAQSGFARGVDISTPEKALAFLPVGLAYFMLAPFPWTIVNVRQGFTLPEMLFFYWLIIPMIRGVAHLARHHLANSLMILLITAGVTFGYAVGQGNVGTIYRHRAQVLPFFLIFAAVGIEQRRAARAAAAASALPEAVPLRS
jgi:hypothetical protein